MGKYTIKHVCGHDENVQLFGKMSYRDHMETWLSSKPCPACRAKIAEEKIRDITGGEEMPKLTGSEKQVAWASTIRADLIDQIFLSGDIDRDEATRLVASVTKARDLIDLNGLTLVGALKTIKGMAAKN